MRTLRNVQLPPRTWIELAQPARLYPIRSFILPPTSAVTKIGHNVRVHASEACGPPKVAPVQFHPRSVRSAERTGETGARKRRVDVSNRHDGREPSEVKVVAARVDSVGRLVARVHIPMRGSWPPAPPRPRAHRHNPPRHTIHPPRPVIGEVSSRIERLPGKSVGEWLAPRLDVLRP